MENNVLNSKLKRNYYVDIIAFLPFLLLLISGIIMLLYHTGKQYSATTFGFDGNEWLLYHKIISVIAIPLIIIHLSLHFSWLKNLFSGKLKNKHKGKNITLMILFLLCTLTSVFSWLIFNNTEIGNGLKGLHNKLGLALIIFFIIHLSIYFKWFIGMTWKMLNKSRN